MKQKISKDMMGAFKESLPYTEKYIRMFGKMNEDGSYEADLIVKYPLTNVVPEEIYKKCVENNKTWDNYYKQVQWREGTLI